MHQSNVSPDGPSDAQWRRSTAEARRRRMARRKAGKRLSRVAVASAVTAAADPGRAAAALIARLAALWPAAE